MQLGFQKQTKILLSTNLPRYSRGLRPEEFENPKFQNCQLGPK